MNFWDFAHERPGAVLVGLFMIVFTIETVARIIANSRKGTK